ncbi:MAG: hypothetical protein ABI595_05115 [Actinomycetota bacterium]
MSTQQLQMPDSVIIHRSGRRLVVAASIATALFAGALIGRETAPTTPSLGVRASTLSAIGALSLGDARRAEMLDAMNGLRSTRAPATQLNPDVVSPGSARAEMFQALEALERTQHQRI